MPSRRDHSAPSPRGMKRWCVAALLLAAPMLLRAQQPGEPSLANTNLCSDSFQHEELPVAETRIGKSDATLADLFQECRARRTVQLKFIPSNVTRDALIVFVSTVFFEAVPAPAGRDTTATMSSGSVRWHVPFGAVLSIGPTEAGPLQITTHP